MAYDRDLAFVYRNPTKIVFGENTVKETGIEVSEFNCSKAFVLTDKGVIEAGLTEQVEKALGKKHVGTYDGCIQDSGFHIVNEAAGLAREAGADCLVSVGGGSVIDTAKGTAILLKSGGQLHDYMGFQMLSEPQAPHIAIPTTAGTGSEVTNVAVVKDWDRNQKQLIGSNYIFPDTAILDPLLTAGLPPMLTATTGMDAMTHAVEAIVDTPANPIADAMGLHAIRLILEYLPVCVEKGDDLFARGQQQIAAAIAGVSFANSQVGIVHAIAHTLGGVFKVPHGLGNSIILPYSIMYNLDEVADRYALIAKGMGLEVEGKSDEEAAEIAANAIWDLTKKLGIPQKLSEVGVPEDGLEEVADVALSDGAIVYNAKPIFETSEILNILKKAY
ncbi:MAG TPA: iron-containing alcohol dehydrogenase [Candidatus Anoxymicrobiaceae bacterium]|jgi:aldehyde dehydrogenase (NAD+)